MKWINKFPKEEGSYWFYGNPTMGSMGEHYRNNYIVEPEMFLIEIFKISSGWMATTRGYFVSDNKFDTNKTNEGWYGYWAKAELPEKPKDIKNLFGASIETV